MESTGDDLTKARRDDKMEQAYYILLSLCREYSVAMINKKIAKDECLSQIKQIRNDMKQLDKDELLNKVDKFYAPLLTQLRNKISK